jgi:hypothetical protein
VPGGWGRKGATFINLKKVKKTNALRCIVYSVENSSAKNIGQKILPEEKIIPFRTFPGITDEESDCDTLKEAIN